MLLIGLTGYAGAGKDEVAKILVREHGFNRVGFADPMRRIMYATNPIIDWAVDYRPGEIVRPERDWRPVRLQELVDGLGWDMAKREYAEIRALLQRFGNDACKPEFGDDFWTTQGVARARGATVFSDCRFDVECEAIIRRGGQIWSIVRPGVGPVNDHVSDSGQGIKHASLTILNDGSLSDLAYAVFGAVTRV